MTDYDRIAQAIDFIVQHAGQQPSLDEIAAQVHLSPFHFQRLFSRWAGVTPKRFLQVLTVDRAKALLAQELPLLEVSLAVGLSGASRLHDHFVQLEAVTPGEFKRGGEGLEIRHALRPSPFGPVFVAHTPRGLCSLAFVDDHHPMTEPLARLQKLWPQARLVDDPASGQALVDRVFGGPARADRPLSLHVQGTNFQIQVWQALLQLPPGRLTTYGQLAEQLGRPGAARAVGQAVGHNPLAFVIPCHRVIQRSGQLGGYHWGPTRKHAIHAWESARWAA